MSRRRRPAGLELVERELFLTLYLVRDRWLYPDTTAAERKLTKLHRYGYLERRRRAGRNEYHATDDGRRQIDAVLELGAGAHAR